jgi:hypothetical protein
MKNTVKVLGLAAIIAAIAFNALVITGCPEPEPTGPTLVKIEVTSEPTKKDYTLEDAFDPAGLVVTAYYDDETTEVVTGYTINGYDNTKTGTQTITVTYEGKTASFTVTVNPKSVLYVITGSGTAFTAKKGGAVVGEADKPIQTVINAIRTDANGAAVNIQFGDGTAVLDIGTASASFNNTWGAVTLSGKITGNSTTNTAGTIAITDDVSITSTADIANTASSSNGRAVYSNSSGAITISGGTVAATGIATAVYSNSTGLITVSGTAKVSTATTQITNAAIWIASSGTGTGVRLAIEGGTVENTASGRAIHNTSTGEVVISGGTVQGANQSTSRAVVNASTGKITVSGGVVTSGSTSYGSINNEYSGMVSITGGTVQNSRTGIAVNNTSSGKITVSGGVVTSANTSSTAGTITIANSGTATDVRLEVTGGTVENTSTTTGNAIRNNSTGAVSITGGTVTKAGTGGYAISNNGDGVITVGPGATVTGEQQLVKQ